MTIVLLTLQEHQSGIWITRLRDRLLELKESVEIVTLESTFECLSNPFPTTTTLVVNRVSDATVYYKETVALLTCCHQLWNLQVWNGGSIYAMVANKWCHSALLQQAGLDSPNSQRLHHSNSTSSSATPLDTTSLNFPLLYKPNAGGFGAGVVKLESRHHDLPPTHDGMAVLQEYMNPYNNEIYRVWFLQGKVQCGLVRQNEHGETDEFTTGCAASGVCSLQDRHKKLPKLLAYKVPKDVRDEIEQQLLPLMISAECGSIEFLCDGDEKRYYFDINLLSTLPLVETVVNANEVWGDEYDPWKELASAIADSVATTTASNSA